MDIKAKNSQLDASALIPLAWLKKNSEEPIKFQGIFSIFSSCRFSASM